MPSSARWLLGVGITTAGVAALIASGFLDGDGEWVSSLLLDTGTVLLLALPLLLVERLFERRVEQVERDTAAQVAGVRDEVATVREDVAAALGRLQDQTDARLGEQREADEATVEQARQDVSYENVRRLLDVANRLRAVSSAGVRVPVSGALGPRVKFHEFTVIRALGPEGKEFSASVVDVEGQDLAARAVWSPNERGPEVFAALVESWQRQGTYPGQGFLDTDSVFEGLITTLAMVIARRRQGAQQSLGPIIERISEHWVLTERGMEHLGFPPYVIDAAKVRDQPAITRDHMLEKTWVLAQEEEFRNSFQAATLYFQGPEARRAALPDFLR
jgi:hypothetical protein